MKKLIPKVLFSKSIQDLITKSSYSFLYRNKGGILKVNTGSKLPSREQIIAMAWDNENPSRRGLQSNGLYAVYTDPNGRGLNVGPGLKVGASIGSKKLYTKEELDNAAYQFGLDSLKSIGESYNNYYGTNDNPTPFDDVDDRLKLLMLDTSYLNGSLPQEKWPKLYEAVKAGNIPVALLLTRSTFMRNGKKYYDNDRVRRRAALYPEYTVDFKDNSAELPIVTLVKN